MKLSDPKSVESNYEYDPVTDKYIYRKTFKDSDFDIDAPLVLTPREYDEKMRQEAMKAYFREKINAIDDKLADDESKKDLLPTYYIKSGLFESIFGSNTIDVKPTGSVEIDLGVRYTKQDNPILSPRNRSNTAFDFDQRINLSLIGKVGTRLNVNLNYDTKSTFAFQNLFKLDYTPTEDDIVQSIELGNVSMPLSGSLVRGAQSLFGVKTQLKFGKTTVTGVFSEQKSQTKTVTAEGGGTVEEFNLFALDYDADRHFFLSQYFRNRYDWSLRNYPFIDSRVQITRVEVWVTNRQNRVSSTDNNFRNIVALQDLGEAQLTQLASSNFIPDADIVVLGNTSGFFNVGVNTPSDNGNNKFDPVKIGQAGSYLNNNVRDVGLVDIGFNGFTAAEGKDYAKLENARKLTSSEFTYHPQLGYISLSQRLTNDEVLAVAYEYTVGDQVYQVGEFGNDGVDATVVTTDQSTANSNVSSQALVLKMLKSNLTDVSQPIWNLMMKNIYQIPGAYQLSQEDFKLNIVYADPSPLNYIDPVQGEVLPSDVKETPLLKVFNMDRLNFAGDPEAGGDGFFDFVPNLTVDPQYGRIIFTTVEPFGQHLFKKLTSNSSTENYADKNTYNGNQKKYVFNKMYDATQAASLDDNQKNKFLLKGKYSSTGGNGIPLGAFNVPQGSVLVTAGGRVLTEGIDYTVNYQAGRVQILDPSLKASNIPIEVSVENNSIFGQQTRRFSGVNIEHKFSDKFVLGGTLLNLNEKPLTQKSNFGTEPVNNTIYGVNTEYATEVPFLTRLANMYPTIETEVPSNIAFKGEVAFLRPSTPKGDNFAGESTIYVDDFEGSQSTIDMSAPSAWFLSSPPVINNQIYANNDLAAGDNRAKLAWYSIDPIFYSNQRPDGVTDDMLSLNKTRRVFNDEVFPNRDIVVGQTTALFPFDLSFYPSERGPYNYNPLATNNTLPVPQDSWGGITRAINTTDFQRSNVEYIQFWVMDPYVNNETDQTNVGKVFFNLGEISEDVLKDGRKQYENGLPVDGGTQNTVDTSWGKLPSTQSLVYAFDTDVTSRTNQDVGFDGLNNLAEAAKFTNFASLPDPSADDYTYYLNTSGDILQRYKKYNGLDGNSPVNVSDTNRGATTLPDAEDVNRDNTMNTINAYYEYSFEVKPGIQIGDKYVTDIKETLSQELPDGTKRNVRWIQYKIPIFNPERIEGGVTGFNSIRFMRMYLTGFKNDITLRFGTLELLRGDWRRYEASLDENNPDKKNPTTTFDVAVVNVLENEARQPIPYVLPPGVYREQLTTNNQLINQNEQSLSLKTCAIDPGDSRAVFKATSVDMRQFNKLRMFMHAESVAGEIPLNDGEMIGFIRFGNDFTDNYYQIELPLKVTNQGAVSPYEIWPEDNQIELLLEDLTKLKLASFNDINYIDKTKTYYKDEAELNPAAAGKINRLKLGIKGNPDFGNARNLMVGIKNNTITTICGEAWFNELRLSDMDNEGGMAALASLDANIADLATFSATGRMSTIGFGSLEQGPNERSREEVKQYDVVTNINVGKLLPQKARLNIPFNIATGEEFVTPEFDPEYADVKLEVVKNDKSSNSEAILNRAIDYTKRNSYSLIGVRKERGPEQKKRFYDIENVTLNYSYSEMSHHSYEIEDLKEENVKTGVDYTHAFTSKEVKPLGKNKFLSKNPYLRLIQDINFKYLPENISFSSNILRDMNRQQFRQIDVEGIALDPLYRRNFGTNYNYVINYNLTQSLKLNYNASNDNIVRNYLDSNNVARQDFTIWDDFFSLGAPNNHKQSFRLNYDLPIHKLPIFSFIKSTYAYTSNFDWRRSNTAMSTVKADNGVTYRLGNTIQNANTHTLNSTFDMNQLYKYLGYKNNKKKNKKKDASAFAAPPGAGPVAADTAGADENKDGVGSKVLNGALGVLTSVKNIRINYSQNNGTLLPGYLPSVGFFGTSAPTLGYVFGSQDDIRQRMAYNGYLTDYQDFNQNYTQVSAEKLNMTASVELIKDFKIELVANRVKADNFSEQYNVQNGVYNAQSPYSSGNYAISTVLIRTSFDGSNAAHSKSFDAFKNNRLIIANRLAEQYYGTKNFPVYDNPNNPIHAKNMGYPVGFGKNSQDVLIPALLAAYSGSDANTYSTSTFKNLPIPNWNIKYTGLMKLGWFKENFKRFSLQHGYQSDYTINSYRSNFEYTSNPGGFDEVSGNYNPEYLISNINLTEQFNPLIRADFELQSSFKFLTEVKRDRSMSLSFDNNLLTDVKGLEYTIGLGYRVKNISFNSRFAPNGTGVIKSDINLKVDFSLRNNKTVIRYLDVIGNDKLSAGQDIWSIKFTADYSFSKNLMAILFYDHAFSQAVISTSFPMTNIRSGFTLRYNFGN
ncbi:MAG: cell surface protein SprA [Flavobacteriales bacterium]|nr:cell surface protein SprA [Flavobacteriales bacterium]